MPSASRAASARRSQAPPPTRRSPDEDHRDRGHGRAEAGDRHHRRRRDAGRVHRPRQDRRGDHRHRRGQSHAACDEGGRRLPRLAQLEPGDQAAPDRPRPALASAAVGHDVPLDRDVGPARPGRRRARGDRRRPLGSEGEGRGKAGLRAARRRDGRADPAVQQPLLRARLLRAHARGQPREDRPVKGARLPCIQDRAAVRLRPDQRPDRGHGPPGQGPRRTAR